MDSKTRCLFDLLIGFNNWLEQVHRTQENTLCVSVYYRGSSWKLKWRGKGREGERDRESLCFPFQVHYPHYLDLLTNLELSRSLSSRVFIELKLQSSHPHFLEVCG
jgi:hypothetical protein